MGNTQNDWVQAFPSWLTTGEKTKEKGSQAAQGGKREKGGNSLGLKKEGPNVRN